MAVIHAYSCLTSFPLHSSLSTCLGDESTAPEPTGCVMWRNYHIVAQSLDSRKTKTVGFDGEVHVD
jgi:hypothetical protein